ncbi:DUF2065 domain-containing protein [Povalibacter sp.]|uniref:DUF2065 domain-containing protein n=1 Tax=Povalibacter sp. TaxID=1962978 RepID=UPI002F420529
MNWSDLLAAFALYLVLEGIMPFVNPQAMKRFMLTMAQFADRHLRIWGFISMALGLVLLYAVRS